MAADYTTKETVAARMGTSSSVDLGILQTCVTAASRQVERYCGRSFWRDATVVAREVYASDGRCVDLLDQGDQPAREISTTTGLIVKIDTTGTGAFGTTLTIGTDFLLLPRNAAADGRGFSEVVLTDNYSFPVYSNGRPGVQITATFGWPADPSEVVEATIAQSIYLYKQKDAPFGAAALGDGTPLFMRASLSVAARGLLSAGGLQVVPVG